MRPRLRVTIRGYCYGCRRRLGPSWHRAYGSSRGGHRWAWEYLIKFDHHTLLQRQSFRTWARACASADRSYRRLAHSLSRGVCEIGTAEREPP